MGKKVILFPASEVKLRAIRQKIQTGIQQLFAALALDHRVQLVTQFVKMQYIGRRIINLLLAQRGRAPVRALLLFRDINPQQLLADVLIAVLVGVGAGKSRGRTRTVNRRQMHAKIFPNNRQIKPGEMKDFGARRIR
jgi:hypothetical protein